METQTKAIDHENIMRDATGAALDPRVREAEAGEASAMAAWTDLAHQPTPPEWSQMRGQRREPPESRAHTERLRLAKEAHDAAAALAAAARSEVLGRHRVRDQEIEATS